MDSSFTEDAELPSAGEEPSRENAGADGTEPKPNPPVASQESPEGRPSSAKPDTLTEARVGVGKKGRNYGGGFVSEPARLYFGIRERVVFDVQIPQALKMFKALDPQGKGPETDEEFKEKVLKQNGIQLPELPDGQTYVYDPEQEQLMIRRPSR